MTDKKCDVCEHKADKAGERFKISMCSRKGPINLRSCHIERTGGGWRYCGADAKYFKAAD
jgi:hypothetical protein